MLEKTHLAQWRALHRNAWMASLHTWWGCQFSTAASTFSGEVCRCHCRDAGEGLEVCKPSWSSCLVVPCLNQEMKQDIQVAEQENKTKAEVKVTTEVTEVSNCEPALTSMSGHPKADPAFQCKAGKACENKILKCSMSQHVWLEAAGTSDHHQSWGGRTADVSEEPGYRLLPSEESFFEGLRGLFGLGRLGSRETWQADVAQYKYRQQVHHSDQGFDRDASSHDICACTMGAQYS